MRNGILVLLLSLCYLSQAEDYNNGKNSDKCDSDSISTKQKVSKLTPNQFYKICPEQTSKSFGQPQCGDGTNFAFFFSRPTQRYANNQKILIELMGGGACWDANTCGYMASYLTFPQTFNKFVGLSCSEISQGASSQTKKFPINMLCAGKVGDVDFRGYNSIIVPYCTQDVHIGSNNITYDGGSTILHHGAHNMMSTLRWIFANFPNPTHIALTGCSAGGTALPIVYDLLNKHYNTFGVRSVQINTIIDSPVFLTPKYFLKNSFGNWNPWPLVKRIDFNYQRWQYSVNYPIKLWDHILKRGFVRDQWGFVTHTNDETSQFYYTWMNGDGEDYSDNGDDLTIGDDDTSALSNTEYYNDTDDGGGRKLNVDSTRRLNGNDVQEQWWEEMTRSVSVLQSKHKNVNSYFIEGNGHCSFGLYYPLQEDGFEAWASDIFQENTLLHESGPAIPLFLVSIMLGLIVTTGILYSANDKRTIQVDDDVLLNDNIQKSNRSYLAVVRSILFRCKTFPITAGYILATTIYFWTMIFSNSFAHPLNNPSLGPSAIVLSRFGINNPAMIVYKRQFYRLLTSNFLCSGIITYTLSITSLWVSTRPLERLLKGRFWIVGLIILLGSNLIYVIFGIGASCSSMALVLGLNSFYAMVLRVTKGPACFMSLITIFLFSLCSLVFSFNSWVMLLSAMVIGAGSATAFFDVSLGAHSENTSEDGFTEFKQASPDFRLRRKPLYTVAIVYGLIFFLICLRLRQPEELYLQPFFTGCDLMYSDEVRNIAMDYINNGRALENGDDDDNTICAQFCLPHLATRGVIFGAKRIFGLPVSRGSCQTQGYDEHLADKTFKYFSYSLDVEIFIEVA